MSLNDIQLKNITNVEAISEDAISTDLIGPPNTLGDAIVIVENTSTDFVTVTAPPVAADWFVSNFDSLIPLDSPNPYLSLVTSQFQHSPIFLQIVDLFTKGAWENSILLRNMWAYFDLDAAIGNQLDIIGQWVGISRNVSVPIDGVFFSFDETGLGFDQAYWERALGNQNSVIPDREFRNVIKAKIALNNWDGTIPSIISALQICLPNNSIVIEDYQDMTMRIIIGRSISPIYKALITQGYFNFKPSGVSLSFEFVNNIFTWGDATNTWGVADWASGLAT